MIVVSVDQVIKIPRSPPGPQFISKDKSNVAEQISNNQKQIKTKYVLMILQDDFQKQQEALIILEKLSKPLENIYMSEDELVQKHI